MVKAHLTECLTQCCGPQISLKSVCVEHWNECLDGVERRTGFRNVFSDMATSARKDCVHSGDAIGRCLDLNIVYGFEKTRGGQEEGGVTNSSSSRDNLAAPSVDRFLCERGIKDAEFDTANRLVT